MPSKSPLESHTRVTSLEALVVSAEGTKGVNVFLLKGCDCVVYWLNEATAPTDTEGDRHTVGFEKICLVVALQAGRNARSGALLVVTIRVVCVGDGVGNIVNVAVVCCGVWRSEGKD